MTYPPQQPGPYGQPQQPGGYGGQPDPWSQQPPYQGFGGYPGGPTGPGYPPGPGGYGPPPGPPPRNTGKIVAIVVIALLVLGGGLVGVYFLTQGKGDDKASDGNRASTDTRTASETPSEGEETGTAEQPSDDTGPAAVVDSYIEAYERKSFSTVTNTACAAYKDKYGTDTSELENRLAVYEITGAAKGEPVVDGNVATGKIDLTLDDGTVRNVTIQIKIVREDGEWRFCGEEEV